MDCSISKTNKLSRTRLFYVHNKPIRLQYTITWLEIEQSGSQETEYKNSGEWLYLVP